MVGLISIALGSMALIISLSVLDGYEKELKEKAVKFTSHIKISSFRNDYIFNSSELIKKLKSQYGDFLKVSPSIEREGLISFKGRVEGIVIKGFKAEYDLTSLKDNIIQGSFNFNSEKEVVIGKRLAQKLNLAIGDQIILYAIKSKELRKSLMPKIDKFKVSGIYETGMAQYDDIYCYIPYHKAINFFEMPLNSTTSIDLMLNSIDEVIHFNNKLNETLGYPYYSYSVFDLHSSIFAWIEMQRAPIPLILGLISIVAFSSIITILLISVVEKTHSIGILRALGMQRNDVIKSFVFQGLVLGFLGTLIGCGIGLILGLVQQHYQVFKLDGNIYFIDALPINFKIWHFVLVIFGSVIFSLIATLIPSFIAAKIEPIKAIRFK